MEEDEDEKYDDQATFRTMSDIKRRVKKVAKLKKRKPSFMYNEYTLAGLEKDEAELGIDPEQDRKSAPKPKGK